MAATFEDPLILEVEDLKNIQWSDESLPLSEFVTTYPFPQLVQVAEGFDGGFDESSLSSGQVLKIHTLTTERKLLCYDRHNKEVHIPMHTGQKVVLRPENYDTVYQRVADLSRAKPIPPFVEVTRGYYNVDSNVDYELSVEPGEKLEVVNDNVTWQKKKSKFMTFRNMEGVKLKIPFDCVAGFKPLVDNKEHLLADVIPTDSNQYIYPFHIEFVSDTDKHHKLGILKCMSVYDDKLIIASCGHDTVGVVFMIPLNLEVTVKVAVGTLKNDPAYDTIRRSFHNFQSLDLESDVQETRNNQFFRTSSEVTGFTYKPGKNTTPFGSTLRTGWETFEEENKSEGSVDENNVQETVNSNNTHEHDKKPEILNSSLPDTDQRQEQHIDNMNTSIVVENGSVGAAMSITTDTIAQQNSIAPQTNGSVHMDESVESTSSSTDASTVVDFSVEEMCECLRSLRLEKYVETFDENQIDGALFCQLDIEEFQDLGFNKFEIKKLFFFKDGWRPKLK